MKARHVHDMDRQMSDLMQMLFAMRHDADESTNYGAQPPADDIPNGAPVFFMMLENFMPFLPPQQQKNVATVLQLMDLRQRFFDYAAEADRKHTPNSPNWRIELLTSIRPHMPDNKQRMFEIMIKIIEINALMQMPQPGGNGL